jgi:hypothetical protein
MGVEGKTKILLQKEFPDLIFLDLPGYGIRYSRRRWTLPFVVLAQVPKILLAIKKERSWVADTAARNRVDAIISDNRFGFVHPSLPSYFITHQLYIQTGLGAVANRLLQRINYRYIRRFTECWVPDVERGLTLAGSLSHPAKLPAIPVRYIGPLSRFSGGQQKGGTSLLVLLSGPEPQRTLLEKKLLRQLETLKDPVVFVRGLPGSWEKRQLPPHITVHDHLPAADLKEELEAARLVISRCGYSTVMDLVALKKKSILIPTPGQTEQEYLARHLMQQHLALCIPQEEFDLASALNKAISFPYEHGHFSMEGHTETIAQMVATLRGQKTDKTQEIPS